MCGLPGSGKSTLARELERKLNALRWDKDEFRELLFPAARTTHDRALNDFCMEMLYASAQYALKPGTYPNLILDGRPFGEEQQRRRLREVAKERGANLVFVLCTAPMEVLRGRIASATHVAPDRNVELLERLAAVWEPLNDDHISVDTSKLSTDEALGEILTALADLGLA